MLEEGGIVEKGQMENRVIRASRSLSNTAFSFSRIHKEVFHNQCDSLISLKSQSFLLVVQSDAACAFLCETEVRWEKNCASPIIILEFQDNWQDSPKCSHSFCLSVIGC